MAPDKNYEFTCVLDDQGRITLPTEACEMLNVTAGGWLGIRSDGNGALMLHPIPKDDLQHFLEEQLQDPEFRREYIACLRNEIAELRDALKPFANLFSDPHSKWIMQTRDERVLVGGGTPNPITVADIRRAKTVLERKE